MHERKISKRNTELNEQVTDLKIKLEEEEKQKEKLLLKQQSQQKFISEKTTEFEEKATRLVKLEDEITRLKTAHSKLEEGSHAKDENSVEIENTVLICNTPDDRVPTEPKSSVFCHFF